MTLDELINKIKTIKDSDINSNTYSVRIFRLGLPAYGIDIDGNIFKNDLRTGNWVGEKE